MYGSIWKIEFDNEYLTTSIAEQFTAISQIYLAELYKDELFLIKSEIKIQFSANQNITEPIYRSDSSNYETIWFVEFPIYEGGTKEDLDRIQFIYVVFITAIVLEISILPQKNLIEIFEKHLKEDDLASKATFGRDYERIYRNFIKAEDFESSQRKYFTPKISFSINQISKNSFFRWNDEISTTYDPILFKQYIQNRINFTKPFEITLPILKSSKSFRIIVQNLREKKWLDWHIYMAVGTVIMNFKMQNYHPIDFENSVEVQKFVREFQTLRENECYIPIPELFLTEQRIENDISTSQIVTVLPSYGLENHSKAPNFKGILELLSKRFNYLIDGSDLKVFE